MAATGEHIHGRTPTVKAALSQVAFARSSDLQGAIALLDAALAAHGCNGSHLPSTSVDHALYLLKAQAPEGFEGILQHK